MKTKTIIPILMALLLVFTASGLLFSENKTFSETITVNNWTFMDNDYFCFGYLCTIYPRVCNDYNDKRSLPLEIYIDLEPIEMFSWKEVKTGTTMVVNDSICSEVGNGTTVCNNTYVEEDVKTPMWKKMLGYVLDNQRDKDHKFYSASMNFGKNECKDFKVVLINRLLGIYKFDVNDLDPLITTQLYSINNSFTIDINASQSNMTIAAGQLSLGLT